MNLEEICSNQALVDYLESLASEINAEKEVATAAGLIMGKLTTLHADKRVGERIFLGVHPSDKRNDNTTLRITTIAHFDMMGAEPGSEPRATIDVSFDVHHSFSEFRGTFIELRETIKGGNPTVSVGEDAICIFFTREAKTTQAEASPVTAP